MTMRLLYVCIFLQLYSLTSNGATSSHGSLHDYYDEDEAPYSKEDIYSERQAQRGNKNIWDLIYKSEPFLTQEQTFSESFYDIATLFIFNIWDGFLKGLYEPQFNSEQTTSSSSDQQYFLNYKSCLDNRSRDYLKTSVFSVESASKETFFLQLASIL